MASREEVIFLCVYLIVIFIMYIISEVLMGVKFPKDFVLIINDTLNLTDK